MFHALPFLSLPLYAYFGLIFILIGLGFMFYSEFKKQLWIEYIFKPVASMGFILIAIAPFLEHQPYAWLNSQLHQYLLIALILSFIGDMFLLGRSQWAFLVGLISFWLAHAFYFISLYLGVEYANSIDILYEFLSLLFFCIVGVYILSFGIFYYISEFVPKTLRVPAFSYVCLIALMFSGCIAFAFSLPSKPWITVMAGGLFWISDLSVARERFMNGGFWNRVWGLSFYYIAQALFALHFYIDPFKI